MALRPALQVNPPRGHRRVSAPAIEPVTATEFRTYIKADSGVVADAEANSYIAQAREFIEEKTGLALITQTWRMSLDAWPGYREFWWDGVRETAVTELLTGTPRVLAFPRYPLASITSVKTYDEASTETTVIVADLFDIDTETRPGRLSLKFGQLWPLATRPVNAIMIDYVAGFGAAATDVPAGLRGAVLTLAGYLYEHRGECEMTQAYMKSGAYEAASMHAIRGL